MASAVEPQMARGAGVAQLRGLLGRRPSTLHMVKEALQAQDGKGASVFTIKQFILDKYPTEDPIRLKYLLKQALSKGLSRGELVRPPNSSAVGATGTFLLAPKEPQHRQHPGQANPGGGPALKAGQKGTPKGRSAALGGAQQRGTKKQPLAAVKQRQTAKPVDAQPRAAEKARRDGAKTLRAADHGRVRGKGHSGPPRAAEHPQAPGKGHSGPPGAVAAEDAGGGKSDCSAGAGAKGPQKVPGGKSKGKVLKGAEQAVPKAQGGQGRVRKRRVPPGAGQGEARLQSTALPAEDRKAL